mgnify:CR=1 FL=1
MAAVEHTEDDADVSVEELERVWTTTIAHLRAQVFSSLDASESYPPKEPGSDLAEDDAACTEAFWGSTIVGLGMSTAQDSLKAAIALDEAGHRPVVATTVLARTTIETAASGLWLLQPQSHPERVCRTLRWWHQNGADQRKSMRHLDPDNVSHSATLDSDHADLQRQIRAVATANGIAEKDALGSASATEMIREAGGDGALLVWTAASGVAHGRFWTATGIGMDTVLIEGPDGDVALTSQNRHQTLTTLLKAAVCLLELHELVLKRGGGSAVGLDVN